MIAGGLYYIVNGPAFTQSSTPVQGFVVDANTLKVLSTFRPGSAELSNPHDIAVSPDGEKVFVVQLDPHRAWKFVPKGISLVKSNTIFFVIIAIFCLHCTCIPDGKNSEVLPNTSVDVSPAISSISTLPSAPTSSSNPAVKGKHIYFIFFPFVLDCTTG